MGLARRVLWGSLLLLAATQAVAGTNCDQADRALRAWQSDDAALVAGLNRLEAALAGKPVATAALSDALGAPADGPAPPPTSAAPPSLGEPDCPSLEDAYQQADRRRAGLLDRQRQLRARWFAQPRDQRRALTGLDDLYSSLGTGSTALRGRISDLLALTPALNDDPAGAAARLDALLDRPPPGPADPIPARRIEDHGLALRASLWHRHGALLLARQAGNPLPLLAREYRLARERVQATARLSWHRWTGGAYLPLLSNLVALLLGVAVFAVVWRLCRLARQGLLRLHGRIMAYSGERRWPGSLSRLIASLAPLLPWVLLWLALDLAAPLIQATPSTRALAWLLPAARLYVIFGLLWLGGEWLMLRVAQGAGTYLNGEQTAALSRRAKRLALWLLVPWALLLIANALLGPSLSRLIALWLVILATYAELGRLLAGRADDYRLCLETILPKAVDRPVAAALRPLPFPWTAPLLLPVALLYFLGRFLDRLFSESTWYLRIKARWFRLRAGPEEEDGERADQDDGQAARDYQRWFGAHLPEDREDPDEAPFIDTGLLEAMGKSVALWREDESDENTLLVSGEKGSGKSMTVRRLAAKLADQDPDLRVLSVAVPPKTVEPEAVTALIAEALGEDLDDGPASLVKGDERRPPTLLILDEAQNVFLSRIGGLDGWRTLLRLTNARLDNLFWLVLLNNQSWAYLCNVFGRDYQFRNALRVKPWTQGEIRSLVLSRHQRTGLTLRYDEILLSSRGPDAGNVRNAEQRYFALLWDACRGNPMAALRLWLGSVTVKGRVVRVALPKTPAGSVLEKTGENLMFVYAAIAIHENLASAEIAAVTNLPENVVRYAIKAGVEGGFVRQSEEDNRYRLVPLWYHTVIHYLTRKNLLHE